MNKILCLLFISNLSMASVCPQPQDLNPLQSPWQELPFAEPPQDVSTLHWVSAKILYNHAGVTCTYHGAKDETYTIWWNKPYIKPNQPKNWYDDGRISLICAKGIQACSFEIMN